MRLSTAVTFAACCASTQAFSDTVPFLLFSTSKLAESVNHEQLQTNAQVIETTKGFLSSCPTEHYLLVSQPNVNALYLSDSLPVPNLRRASENTKIQGRFTVAEVARKVDLDDLASYIKDTCEGKQPNIALETLSLEPLPSKGALEKLKKNDEDLSLPLEQLELGSSYTVIYTGGEHVDAPTYEPEFQQDLMPTELKRQVQGGITRRQANSTDSRSLFEKYQFFTPGIFMALVVLVVLLAILFSGISALASLQVSYGAFDKDMGPAAQKKQM